MADRTYAPATEPKAATSSRGAFFVPTVQAKLTVNQPGDQYEQEADRVAEQVVGSQTETVQIQQASRPNISRLQRMPDPQAPVQRMAEPEQEEEAPVQRMAEPEQEEEASVQRMAEPEEEEELSVQRKNEGSLLAQFPEVLKDKKVEIIQSDEKNGMEAAADSASAQGQKPVTTGGDNKKTLKINEEEERVQMKPGSGVPTPSMFFREKLRATKGIGERLSHTIRPQMEYGFGADFGSVRIHTDSSAAELNRDIHARAFTHGSDIYFNSGQFDPDTVDGQKLLAHELTHVVQQNDQIRNSPPPGDVPPAASLLQEQAAPDETAHAEQEGSDTAQPQEALPPADSADDMAMLLDAEPEIPEEDPIDNVDVSPELLVEDAGPLPPPPVVEPEPTEPPDPLELEGPTDQMVLGVATATPSQMAASYPQLGSSAGTQLQADNEALADSVPDLHARSGGIEGELSIQNPEIKAGQSALGDGRTAPDPGQLQAAPHVFGQPAPGNQQAKQEVAGKDDESFFGWLKSNFGSFMSKIRTSDPGADTSAGERPKMVLEGSSDPARTQNLQADSDEEVGGQKDATVAELKNHPGQASIQPVKVEETMPVQVNTEATEAIETEASEGMKDYVDMALPKTFRQAADTKLTAGLGPKLEGVQSDITQAKTTRDTDKQLAVAEAEEETARLNEEADTEQKKTIIDNRRLIANEQRSGMKEANAEMTKFREESGTERQKVDEGIVDRVRTDEEGAAKELDKGETEAKAEKASKEKEAAEKKKELDRENSSGGIWGWVKRKVKAAVKALTDAIDGIFTALREAVKTLIEKAKKAAIALIEAGRKWITEKIDSFRIWVKDKVNKYVGTYFPGLAKRINQSIDAIADTAIAGVNAVADGLKKGIEYLADKLSKFIDSILAAFQTALKGAIRVLGAVLTGDFIGALKIAIETACEVIGIDSKPIFDFLDRAKNQLIQILKHPVQFIINVGKGIQGGLNLFFGNVQKHLFGGVIDWLTGSLTGAGVTLPGSWDAKGIFSLVVQILNLTYDSIRRKVVKALGAGGEKMVSALESAKEYGGKFLEMLLKNDPAALWEEAKDAVGNIRDMLISTISEWLAGTIVKQGILWLISLTNPASALARALKMLFDVVMFLIEKANQIMAFVRSIYDSLAAMVSGEVEKVAKSIEDSLSRAIPLLIGLLASVLGLSGITKTVKNVMKRIRKPIDNAVSKVVKKLVGLAKKAWEKIKGGAKKVKEKVGDALSWLSIKRKVKDMEGNTHTIFIKEISGNYALCIASKPKSYEEFITSLQPKDENQKAKKEKALPLSIEIDKDLKKIATNSRELKKKNISVSKAKEVESRIKVFSDKIEKDMEVLARLTEGFSFSAQGGEIPVSSAPVYGPLHNGFATSMEIKLLTQHGPPGTSPSVNNSAWRYLNYRKTKSTLQPYYVLGHLLGNPLHGPGSTFANLTPLTQDANFFGTNSHFKSIEKHIQREVQIGKILYYKVTVKYGSHSGLNDLRERVNRDIVNGKYKDNFHKKLKVDWIKVIDSEILSVPTQLEGTAHEVDKDGKKKSDEKAFELPSTVVPNNVETGIKDYWI